MRFILALAIVASSLLGSLVQSPAALAQSCTFNPGSVVRLTGTPHLYIVDAQRVLHWGGDTRALAGLTIMWGDQCELGLAALQQTPLGDPYLSSGMPTVGEPIYLSKWEDNEVSPTLLHIQSLADLELFGIRTENYTNFVLDRATYEQRYGFPVGTLRNGPLASTAMFAWSAQQRADYEALLVQMTTAQSDALLRATNSGVDASVSLPAIATCERQGLTEFERTFNASTSLQITQTCLARGTGTPTPTQTPPPSLNLLQSTPWMVVTYLDAGTTRPTITGTEVTATFAAGQVSGSAGCNNYTGGFQVSGSAMLFTPLASTQRFCVEPTGVMDQEQSYFAALGRTAAFDIVTDRLTLRDAGGAVLLTYVPQQQMSLEGTNWTAIDYNNGREAVVSVLAGATITARFEVGQLSGSSGCNTYTGAYTVSGNAIQIGPPASTRIFCSAPAGIMEQEAAYLAALPTARIYRIEGDRLILETLDGARVASFTSAAL